MRGGHGRHGRHGGGIRFGFGHGVGHGIGHGRHGRHGGGIRFGFGHGVGHGIGHGYYQTGRTGGFIGSTQPTNLPLPTDMTVNDVRINQKIAGSGCLNAGIPQWLIPPTLTQQSLNNGLTAAEVSEDVKSINSSTMSINSNLVHMKYLPGVFIALTIVMTIMGVLTGLLIMYIVSVLCFIASFICWMVAQRTALKVYYQRIEAARNHMQDVINVKYQNRNLSWVMVQAGQVMQRNVCLHTILIRPLLPNGNPMPGQLVSSVGQTPVQPQPMQAPGLQIAQPQRTVVVIPAQHQNIVYVDQNGIPLQDQPPQVVYAPQQQVQHSQPQQQMQYAQPQQQVVYAQPQQVQYDKVPNPVEGEHTHT